MTRSSAPAGPAGPLVIDATCTACGSCITTCPEHALSPAPRRPHLDPARCTLCLACLEVCPVDAIRPEPAPPAIRPEPAPPAMRPEPAVHPIETESYRIMFEAVDFSAWSGVDLDVVARMVHATADPAFAESARIGPRAGAAAVTALQAGGPVVCDAAMVVAGVPSVPNVACWLSAVPSAPAGGTRSAEAISRAAAEHPDGALWVIGNAPTALFRLLELHDRGLVRPAAVIGLPVGYVGAAEAKAALWDSGLAEVCVTNRGPRGGSAVAAAALNALWRRARRPSADP